ncbi:MAG TPA: DUF2723 domain-containing protein, partial [Longimicrobiales bacterium]|nr:DUF2723 domain-containing protein [Longimicrobiales bacterium]
LGLSVAVRINLFSAFMSAAAHGLWFLVVHHVLRYFGTDRYFRLAGAFAAVLVSATAFTVWNQSNVNEKVYTVSLLTIALLTWLVFRWQENLGKGKDDNLLVLMAFILALSVGNHLMAFLAAPAILVFVLLNRPEVLVNWKLYPAFLVVGLAGLSIHMYLPIRAGLDPIINEANPTCGTVWGALESIVTYGRAGCDALSESLNRTQYDKPPLVPRQAPLSSQFVNYLQYFDWQWARTVQGATVLFADLRIPFTMLFTGLGVWGAVEHARRDRASFAYVLALFGTVSVGLVYYLNFKYGYSIPDPLGDVEAHEVRERDYFFIVSFSVWGLWAGVGIAAIWKWVAETVVGSLAKAAPVLMVAAVPLLLNWSWADRSYDWAARDWAYALLMSVEPYGVLFTNGDNDTFPLWYVQEVEGLRRDVTVIVTSYLNTPWYTKQLRDLTSPCPEGTSPYDDPTRVICQRPYEADDRAVYTADPGDAPEGLVALELDEPRDPPSRPILELSDSTIERVAETYVPLQEGRTLALGPVQARLRAGQLVYPWHQYALAVISTGLEDGRPIYFASSGNAAAALGLDGYLIRQGLAFRLHEGPLPDTAPAGVEPMPAGSPLISVTGRYVDVPRTARLVDEVFTHHGDIPYWDHWPDASTLGIPNYYAWAYYALAQAAYQQGDDANLDRWSEMGDAWTTLGN